MRTTDAQTGELDPRAQGLGAHAAVLRTPGEMEAMRHAGRIASLALREALNACRPGAATCEVAGAAERRITAMGGAMLLKGIAGEFSAEPFPAGACVSVNDEALHGVPGARVLRPGDVVSVDVGVRFPAQGGWCADVASTVIVEGLDENDPRLAARRALVAATREALDAALDAMAPGVRWSEVAGAMASVAARWGLGVVADYAGHGLGRSLHEHPAAPMLPRTHLGEDFTLREGMTLAIEPVLTAPRAWDPRADAAGTPRKGYDGSSPARTRTRVLADGWTVVTIDATPACHEERSVGVTRDGVVILTAV